MTIFGHLETYQTCSQRASNSDCWSQSYECLPLYQALIPPPLTITQTQTFYVRFFNHLSDLNLGRLVGKRERFLYAMPCQYIKGFLITETYNNQV